VVSDKEEEDVTSNYKEEEETYEGESEYDEDLDGYASSDESESRERWEYKLASGRLGEGH
jgi:hypothetical protein